MRRWKAHRGKIASLSFSRDGRLLASVTGSGRDIFIWDTPTGELVRKLTVVDEEGKPAYTGASHVCFAPNVDLLAVARKRWVEVWNTPTWTRFAEADHDEELGALEVGSGASPKVATSTRNSGTVYQTPTSESNLTRLPTVATWAADYHTQLSFAPDGSKLATHAIQLVDLRNPNTGDFIHSYEHQRGNYGGPVRFSPDSSRLAFCSTKTIESHPASLDDPDDVIRYAGHTNKVWALRYTPDGRSLISASSDGTVRVWEAATGLQKQCFEMNVGKLATADVSPDGTMAAVGGATGEIVVWDLE